MSIQDDLLASIKVHDDAHADEVALSDALWQCLRDLSAEDDDQAKSGLGASSSSQLVTEARFAIALTPRTLPVQARNSSTTFGSLVVNASKATGKNKADQQPVSRLPQLNPGVVYVPQRLLEQHPAIFGSALKSASTSASSSSTSSVPLGVSRVRPIPLSDLILIAYNSNSYDYSVTNKDDFLQSLGKHGRIVRSGEVLSSTSASGQALGWTVAMAEPVLQGVLVPGSTRFLVLPPTDEPASLPNGSSTPNGHADHHDLHSLDDDDGAFDIDESFLAASVLSLPRLDGNSTPISPRDLPGRAPSNYSPSLSPFPSHSDGPLSATRAALSRSQNQRALVQAQALQHPVDSSTLVPQPTEGEDETLWVFLGSRDLSRLGLFSGDWALVESEGSSALTSERRLVQVFVSDELQNVTDETGVPVALFAPTLLHTLPSKAVTLVPAALPFQPAFPIASSVTVARVASPRSVHRVYQSLFLDGLKGFFKDRQRILKRGDVIAVGICEDMARFSEGAAAEDEDEVELPASLNVPTAVVYFVITSLELSPPTEVRAEGGDELTELLDLGEFGCHVDPRMTKLVQSGVEHSLVPDVEGYLGIVDSFAAKSDKAALEEGTPTWRLLEYVKASLRPGTSDYDLHLTVLVKGAHGSGKRSLVKSVARSSGLHLLELDCYDLIGESDVKTEGHLRARIDNALSCSPCIMLLRNIEALARKSQALETGQEPAMTTVLKECFATARQGWKTSGFPVIIVATTCDIEKLPRGVLGAFKEEIAIEAPNEAERLTILRSLTRSSVIAPDVSLRALAVQTAALVANDLVDLVRRAGSAAAERALASIDASEADARPLRVEDVARAGLELTAVDFNKALDKARASYSESIGAPKIPNVTWDDVGGLANVKSDILDTIQLPLEHPELFADGLKKRSGILLYGPPGTGKTLLAKAVATSCSLNFFSVKGPELLNMYIGESEANVRRVFQRARDAKPCVIFFDELDSVAPKRGNQGDSGGVMDRIVSQLLAELDGMSEGKGGSDVFVIGATNRPDLLDPALLRPGRFDRMLYLGVSDTHDAQLKIIQALTRKFKLDPNIRLEDVAALCPYNYTGADFYALCSDAILKAMTRKATEIDDTINLPSPAAKLNLNPPYSNGIKLTPQYYLAEMATPAEIEVLVSQKDFKAALAEASDCVLVPSVSKAEMLHYKTVQQRFSSETMNSDEKMAEKEQQQQQPRTGSKAVGSGSVTIAPPVELSAAEQRRKAKGKGRA
ncbi:BZ3500_MvSof-1268-A1-R1_Chr12-2g03905 [Microbotryum saponariae]|uniref:Peroxisomal ATPase PEX6 n=1 Tax=Microbotryum saponariae TaxID=289078 RepID=A0A2X0KQP5_9BASI|nr:BZ3500_MvSof-1268-A1-R1_Chr12-2g03905 [Microbotryum saponariae]